VSVGAICSKCISVSHFGWCKSLLCTVVCIHNLLQKNFPFDILKEHVILVWAYLGLDRNTNAVATLKHFDGESCAVAGHRRELERIDRVSSDDISLWTSNKWTHFLLRNVA
jgi:hypothetical protein